MKYLLTFLLFIGCSKPTPTIDQTTLSRSLSFEKYLDYALSRNAENKKWEIIYLDQISQATEHNDTEAIEFFTEEHSKLFLDLPEWMKKEVGYAPSWNEKINLPKIKQ